MWMTERESKGLKHMKEKRAAQRIVNVHNSVEESRRIEQSDQMTMNRYFYSVCLLLFLGLPAELFCCIRVAWTHLFFISNASSLLYVFRRFTYLRPKLRDSVRHVYNCVQL